MKYGRIEYKDGTDEIPSMDEAIETDLETGMGSEANAAAWDKFCRDYPTVVAVARAHEGRSRRLAVANGDRNLPQTKTRRTRCYDPDL